VGKEIPSSIGARASARELKENAMSYRCQVIVATALLLSACSAGGASLVGGSSVKSEQASQRLTVDPSSARWQPSQIEVARGGSANSTLIFTIDLQTYRLSESCDHNVRISHSLIGGSIGRRFEYDTYAFTAAGGGTGRCSVTAKFQGSPVRAELAVTVK
jgi:hypothetical protein